MIVAWITCFLLLLEVINCWQETFLAHQPAEESDSQPTNKLMVPLNEIQTLCISEEML